MTATASSERAGPPVRRLADWDAARLRDLADEHGTPLYVLDLARARENYRRVAAAFPDAAVDYAVKANAARPLLATLAAAGAGAECASAGEVRRAVRAGFDGDRVRYTAVNPPGRDLDAVVATAADRPGLSVTAGAADTVDRLADRGYDGRVCIRANPGVGAGHHETVATGAAAKFGVPPERVPGVAALALDRGLDVVGVHAHAGSGLDGGDLDAHRETVARLADAARSLPVAPEVVNVGGGFGVPARPDDPPLDLGAVAAGVRAALDGLDARVVVEPGRYVAADAGVLLTRVNTVKPTPGTVVAGVDAGMTTLLRPALYGAYHHVRNLAPGAGERGWATVTVAGPVCEAGDVLADRRPLPAPARGDLLAVGTAGAYGYAMASRYNARPRPATVVVDGDWSALARRREARRDLARVEREVAPP